MSVVEPDDFESLPQARSSAYDRLRRLPLGTRSPSAERHGEAPDLVEPQASEGRGEDLAGLERRLLGAPAPELSLKQRLERLAAAAGRRQPTRPRAAALEELVQGQRVANAAGEFFLIESDVALDSFHGQLSLSRLRLLAADSVKVLTGEPALDSFDLSNAVFLDTETTGLAGGTGTAAFLIGIGFVDGDRFRVRQYFMRDYHEEAALLSGLAQELRRFRQVVTFNGKLFDLPLLETRYRLCRDSYPLSGAAHFDLLHPARRLWKRRLESCRLQSLEVGLLGLRRRGDVPGELIPNLYFDYVRRRDARALMAVFEHNRIDIVSLFALSVLACQWVEQDLAEDPRDWLSLGRVLERADAGTRARQAYERALESRDGNVRVSALMRLASAARRDGRLDEARVLWEEAAAEGHWRACRDLAVHHEHRTRRLNEALGWVERGLACVAQAGVSEVVAGFERRRRRLRRRLQAHVAAVATLS
jgi:uncharacterized protein